MNRIALSLTLSLTFVLPAVAEDEPQTAEEAALEVVNAHVAKLQAKDAKASLEENWDFGAMCRGIFGSKFSKMNKAERDETVAILKEIILTGMANPEVAELLSKAKYDNFAAKELKKGYVQVQYTVDLNIEGAPPRPSFQWLKQVKGAWKIVDTALDTPNNALTVTLGAQYQQHADKVSPLEYARMMKKG